MALPVVAGLTVAGQIADRLIQGVQSKKNIQRTLAANMKLAEYAYSKDLEMWNLANEYNAPGAQMGRLKDAGLNPNLVYGSGSANVPAQTIPKYQAPRADFTSQLPPVQFSDAISQGMNQFYDFRIKNAQADLLKEQVRNIAIRTIHENAKYLFTERRSEGELERTELARVKSVMEGRKMDVYPELLKYQLQKMDIENQNLLKKGILSDLDIDWYQYKKLLPAFMGLGAGLLFKGGSGIVPRMKSVFQRKNPGQTPAMKNYKQVW